MAVRLGAARRAATASPAAKARPPRRRHRPVAPRERPPTVRIGWDNFYEAKLMAEIYAQVLENAGYIVDRTASGWAPARRASRSSSRARSTWSRSTSGQASATTSPATDRRPGRTNDRLAVLATKGGGISVLDYDPGPTPNAFVVRKDTADSMNLTKMSDLVAVQDQIKWGLPPDCDANPLCSGALKTPTAHLPAKQRVALAACDAPIAQALQAKTIDLAELCSTQPAIAQFGFVQLVDDKQTQPAENIAPIVRNDFLAKVPDVAAFQALLNAASAKMDTATLTQLGGVGVNNKDIAAVAKDWLQSKGLVK